MHPELIYYKYCKNFNRLKSKRELKYKTEKRVMANVLETKFWDVMN